MQHLLQESLSGRPGGLISEAPSTALRADATKEPFAPIILSKGPVRGLEKTLVIAGRPAFRLAPMRRVQAYVRVPGRRSRDESLRGGL